MTQMDDRAAFFGVVKAPLPPDWISFKFPFTYYNRLARRRVFASFEAIMSNANYDAICRMFDGGECIDPFGNDYKALDKFRVKSIRQPIDELFSHFDGRDFNNFIINHWYEMAKIAVFNHYVKEVVNELRLKQKSRVA